MVCNLFAPRATDPDDLLATNDSIGPKADAVLDREAIQTGRTVMAFGRPPRAEVRSVVGHLADAGVRLETRGMAKEGWLRHPLYLPAATRPRPWIILGVVTLTFFG